MSNKNSKKIMERKGIAPYLVTEYGISLIRSLIIKQYGSFFLIKLASGLYTIMHESGLGNPEVEVIYKCEIKDKLPRCFVSKLEAKAYILDVCSGKISNYFV